MSDQMSPSINFTPGDLREIAELAEHVEHVAPIPQPNGKRLPVRISIGEAMGERWVVHITLDPSVGPLVDFNAEAPRP